jgi:hypothetical protein
VNGWTVISDGQLCDMSYDEDGGEGRCCEIASVQIGQLRLCRQCASFVRSIPGLVAKLESRK